MERRSLISHACCYPRVQNSPECLVPCIMFPKNSHVIDVFVFVAVETTSGGCLVLLKATGSKVLMPQAFVPYHAVNLLLGFMPSIGKVNIGMCGS